MLSSLDSSLSPENWLTNSDKPFPVKWMVKITGSHYEAGTRKEGSHRSLRAKENLMVGTQGPTQSDLTPRTLTALPQGEALWPKF